MVKKHHLVAYRELNPYKPKGAKVKRFRQPTKSVKNRVLYAILLSKDIKFADLAENIGVSGRAVHGWAVCGAVPKPERARRVSSVLGYPEEILFNNTVLTGNHIIKPLEDTKYTSILGKTGREGVSNEILHGLFILHDFSVRDVARWCCMSGETMRRMLHTDRVPQDQYMEALSVFFKIPEHILFYGKHPRYT